MSDGVEEMKKFMRAVAALGRNSPYVVRGFNNEGPDGSLQALLAPNPEYDPEEDSE